MRKYKGPERRTYMRLNADCAIDYVKLANDLKPMYNIVEDSYSKDISASGIKFASSEKMPIGAFIELHIKVPVIDKFIVAIGKVVRCDQEGKDDYGIALAFIWINKMDKELIDGYVKGKKLKELRSEMKK